MKSHLSQILFKLVNPVYGFFGFFWLNIANPDLLTLFSYDKFV